MGSWRGRRLLVDRHAFFCEGCPACDGAYEEAAKERAMRKGGGLAFSAVDLARPGSKDKSVKVTGVRREDGTIEVTDEKVLERNEWANGAIVEKPTKPLTEEMLRQAGCSHLGRRKVYRTPLGDKPGHGVIVEDKCVDCGEEWMKSRLNEPEERLFPSGTTPAGPGLGFSGEGGFQMYAGRLTLAGTPVGPEHPVLAEAGPSAVGERVEGCARCRVRTPGRSFCSNCGERSTSFELRPGESGW